MCVCVYIYNPYIKYDMYDLYMCIYIYTSMNNLKKHKQIL